MKGIKLVNAGYHVDNVLSSIIIIIRDMACEACTVLKGMRGHWWSVLAESPLFCCNYLLTIVLYGRPMSPSR
jgi:hypothetical protein